MTPRILPHIDTPGLDWVLLWQLALNRLHRIVIHFDLKHLSTKARQETDGFAHRASSLPMHEGCHGALS